MGSALDSRRICPRCRAEARPGSNACWLCKSPHAAAMPVAAPERIPTDPGETGGRVVPWVVLAVGLAAVSVGIALEEPGWLVLAGVVLGPPLIVLTVQSIRRRQRGEGYATTEGLRTLIVSSALSISAAVILVPVSFAIFLFLMCFTPLGN